MRTLLFVVALALVSASARAENGAAPRASDGAAAIGKAAAAPSMGRAHPTATPAALPKINDSKIFFPLPSKLPRLAKIKACCGYPVSLKEGFRLSFYWLAWESEYANQPYDTAIYTRQGFLIGHFPSAFVYELKLEGSGILRDGRILNYDGDCNYGMGTCFKTLAQADQPLGAGAQGRPLIPFRSIAVDPRYIPLGSTVYVPELVGVLLPDGTRHDGCLLADDVGGAIKQHKLDFFVESYDNFKFIADNLWWHLKATPLLDEPRCAYLRPHDAGERDNDQSDWAMLHRRRGRMGRAERLSILRAQRNRRAAKRWLKRHIRAAHHPRGHSPVAHRR